MGSAGAREPGEARGRADERELGRVHTQAVKIRGREPNHRRGQAHGQAVSRAHGKAHSAALRPDAQQGGDEIRKVQAALNQQGFNVGDPDGKLGKRTKQALIAFQKQRGFRSTGKVDHATLDALLANTNSPAPGASPQNSQPNPAQAVPEQTAPQAAPAAIPAEPGTTGQGDAQPAMPPTEPVPESPQMPDTGTSGRIPAGSPQEDYKENTVPGGDQR
jgi:peptidoglycan hydrolase-like protein with peptidoglycan-binding domain